ncbi:hypothetical protein [Oleiharenicola lentus]|uniref:hypothetical protein n=1 Tax=Oleiharenicola lentus TaxID=2508720 RepID=UPI003F666980
MNWILEHLNLVFIVGGALAWWLNQRGKKAEDAEGQSAQPQQETSFGDADEAERTRRIREEIQRKIQQRMSGQTPPPITEPATTEYSQPPPLIVPARQVASSSSVRAAMARREAERHAEVLEQQAALADRLRMANEMKLASQKRLAFEDTIDAGGVNTASRAKARSIVMEEMRSPEALRRAFIMREVLGPPVALR